MKTLICQILQLFLSARPMQYGTQGPKINASNLCTMVKLL